MYCTSMQPTNSIRIYIHRSVASPLRANIDETVLLVVITEQGENRNQCEEQWISFGFPHGFARRGT